MFQIKVDTEKTPFDTPGNKNFSFQILLILITLKNRKMNLISFDR
jgi:hypothetical protein